MRPLIGIPPCLDERGRWREGRSYHYIDTAYARALEEAGASTVYLTLPGPPPSAETARGEPIEEAAGLVAHLDGLLVPGGDDFPPDRPYPPEARFDPTPPAQIATDGALLAAALERDLPVLAICYGMQLLALHCGGSLHFDLPTDLPDAAPHRLPEPGGRHALAVEADTRLAQLLGSGPTQVNSRHHQAVARAGGARVSARASDGVVEALELPERRFALGVQWHPESMESEHRARLFGGFVAACRGRP